MACVSCSQQSYFVIGFKIRNYSRFIQKYMMQPTIIPQHYSCEHFTDAEKLQFGNTNNITEDVYCRKCGKKMLYFPPSTGKPVLKNIPYKVVDFQEGNPEGDVGNYEDSGFICLFKSSMDKGCCVGNETDLLDLLKFMNQIKTFSWFDVSFFRDYQKIFSNMYDGNVQLLIDKIDKFMKYVFAQEWYSDTHHAPLFTCNEQCYSLYTE